MIRLGFVAVLAVATAAAPGRAAVFEIGDDGSVARLDAPPVVPPAVRRAAPGAARARALRPVVEHAADRYALSPALIDAVARAESGYDQRAVSRAGAGGVMQLMPATARTLGVDRTDAAANIHGGAAYLRQLLDRFDGNLVCAIAAYNAGPGAVSPARCVPPYRETAAYVGAVLDRLAAAAH